MAAPSTAYLFNGAKLPIHVVGVLKLDSLLALKLSEYGANIKALFYLDGLLVVKKGTDVGFIGFAYNTAKLAHHATARKSKIRVKLGANNCVLFNDGGLNTLGDSLIDTVTTFWSNYIKVSLNYKSSYYDLSTEFGIEFKKSTDSTWVKSILSESALASNASQTINAIIQPDYLLADTIQLRAYIINPEGTYLGDQYNFTAQKPILLVDAILRATACATTGDNMAFYMFKDEYLGLEASLSETGSATGIIGYTNDLMTTTLAAGFYAGLFSDFTKVTVVDSGGQLTNYTICTPSEESRSVSVLGYTETNAFLVEITKESGVAFGTEITISGKIRAMNNGVPVSGDFELFSLVLGASAISNSISVSYTTNAAYTYEFEDVISTPTTVGGSLVILTQLLIEEAPPI